MRDTRVRAGGIREAVQPQGSFCAAGSIKDFAGPLFERNIRLSSAWEANTVPVAEFTLSQILFALAQGWLHHRQQRELPGPDGRKEVAITGNYGAKVGIISLAMLVRKVVGLLRPVDLEIRAYDPLMSPESMCKLNLTPVSLKEVFVESEVVSLHAPRLLAVLIVTNGCSIIGQETWLSGPEVRLKSALHLRALPAR